MKKFLAIIMIAILALSLVACGTKEESETDDGTTTEVKKYKFGVIYNANNAFWDKVGNGANAMAEELNATGEYNIDIYAAGPTDGTAVQQVQLFEDMMSQGYDGIIISAIDASTMTPLINQAAEKGVPVICMDTEIADSDRLCFVGTDNYNFGYALGEEINRVLNGEGKVILLSMNPTMTAMVERVRGTEEALAQYPGIEIVETYYETDFNNIQGNIENLCAKYSDFDLVCMNYAAGEQVVNVYKAKGWTTADKHAVLSDDLDPIILGVKEGIADSSLIQGQYNWGYLGVKILVDYLANGVTPDEFVETSAIVCDKDYADEYYADVKAAD